jgi:hypothetical protein
MTTRRTIALVLVVVASVLAFTALPAIYLNRQLLNTDNYTQTSSKLLADPVIRDQVAVYLVDQLYANVDVESQLRAALPAQLQALAGPAAGALRTAAERASKDILARPRAQQAWEDANRQAHIALLAVLDNRTDLLTQQGGNVVLDLKTLLEQLAARVGIGQRVVAALPDSAAQITVLRGNQLGAAQDATKFLKGLPIVLVALSLLCFVIALFVAPTRRRETVRGYGAGLIIAGALMLVVISLAGDQIVDSLARTQAMVPVVGDTWTIVTPLLREATVATIGYGLVMLVGAWLAGPMGAAVAIRHALAPYLREPLVAWAVFAAIVAAVLFWWAPTPATRNPVTAVLLVALLAAGFEGLRRRTAREVPEADLDVALAAHADRAKRLWHREKVA